MATLHGVKVGGCGKEKGEYRDAIMYVNMDSRVHPARDVQTNADIGQACDCKNGINLAIKIEAARKS